MNNGNNISLKDLKDHEVTPPSFLFERIKERIKKEDSDLRETLSPLKDHVIFPPEEIGFDSIMDILRLKTLKDHEIVPPVSFDTILSGAKKATKKEGKIIFFTRSVKKISIAAAVLVLVISSYFILKKAGFTDNKRENEPLAILPAPANTNVAVVKGDPANILSEKQDKKIAYSKKRAYTDQAKIIRENTLSMQIDGRDFSVIDNDILATFASYNEKNAPSFLLAEKPAATTITLDDYTAVNVSEGMAVIMKKMYKTKRNGKPTRRARKQREKLEKWKKADSEFFNRNSTMNPLDPIDLGNFILYK